jgi:nicotinate-nucleotide pyrophosphorylase (carboxylating)
VPEEIAPVPPRVVDRLVAAALDEDGAANDVTTRAVVGVDQWGRGILVAKQDGVIAGLGVAAAAVTALDPSVSFDTLVRDGTSVRSDAELAEIEGRLPAILAGERVALNFLQRMSGIATLTREFVDAVEGTGVRILDTRKTTPGLRHLERYAVRAGGGQNHRFNLSDGVLIKDNHIAAARERGLATLTDIIAEARSRAPTLSRIEIEVTSSDDAEEAAGAGADVILLDNMTLDEVHASVRRINRRTLVEVSGGVTLENVRAYAEAGADFISIGRLTHSAPALDISLEVQSV